MIAQLIGCRLHCSGRASSPAGGIVEGIVEGWELGIQIGETRRLGQRVAWAQLGWSREPTALVALYRCLHPGAALRPGY